MWRSDDRDPLRVHGTWLLAQGFADDEALKAIEDEARGEIEAGVQFALDARIPTRAR